MIFGTENSIQLARFRVVALAEDTLLCKAKQQPAKLDRPYARARPRPDQPQPGIPSIPSTTCQLLLHSLGKTTD
jgi:hypothetical protein